MGYWEHRKEVACDEEKQQNGAEDAERLDGIYYGVPGGGAYDERFGVLCAAGEPARCDQRRPDAAQRRVGGHCAGSGRRQKLCVLLAGGKCGGNSANAAGGL